MFGSHNGSLTPSMHLMQKFLKTDMIFFDQFIVSTVKFVKCFAEFMIPIALLKEFGS